MTWRKLDPYFARRLQLGIFTTAILFGLDYLVTPAGSSLALTTIERTWLPLWVWGATIIVAGLAGLFVEWRILGTQHPFVLSPQRWRWGWISNTAHIILFAVFIVLAGSALVDLVHRGLDGGGWYGWRTSLMWGGFGMVNFAYVRRLSLPTGVVQ